MVRITWYPLLLFSLFPLFLLFLGMKTNPAARAFRLLERCMLGMGMLTVWNAFVTPIGLRLGMNPVNMLIAGCLGAPGLGLLALMGWMV